MPETVRSVVEAWASCDVDEAYKPIWNHVAVVVALVDVPNVVAILHGHALLPPAGQPVLQSPVIHRDVAESWVVEA